MWLKFFALVQFRFITGTALVSLVALPVLSASAASAAAPSSGEIRGAVVRALPLIQRSARASLRERACYTCHNGAIPLIALNHAAAHGLKVDKATMQALIQRGHQHLRSSMKQVANGGRPGGQVDTVGWIMVALHEAGWKHDDVTADCIKWLTTYKKNRPQFTTGARRPPSEHSDFTTTWVGGASLRNYATAPHQDAAQKRSAGIARWLRETASNDTEDSVYRLRSLYLLEEDAAELSAQEAAKLLSWQQPDGGWPQLPAGAATRGEPARQYYASGAYATATALVALRSTGQLKRTDKAYLRGARWLIEHQLPDGSWRVKSRSRPFQKFFDGEFPHGKDQFISLTASSWAVVALLRGLPAAESTAYLSEHPQVRADIAAAKPVQLTSASRNFFNTKILPVLKTSCYQCHSSTAKKLKAELRLDTRAGMLQGGVNGAVIPSGKPDEKAAAASLLMRALHGRDEDFKQMPPGKKLPASVIADFQKWIEMGAPDTRIK